MATGYSQSMPPRQPQHAPAPSASATSPENANVCFRYYQPPHSAPGASSSGPYADLKAQKSFEKGLLEKTVKQTGDIILYDNQVVLYKMESDVMMVSPVR